MNMIQLMIVKELGYKLCNYSKILDFGCGGGHLVRRLRRYGYDAYGCDLKFKKNLDAEIENDIEQMKKERIIRLIDSEYYKIPFDDNFFDFIFSDQVFEHVQDYSLAISEISRVLKPDGFSLHVFPSRYIPIEPHLWIPFGTVYQSRWWLGLWAKLGVRNVHQKNLSSCEVVYQNYDYLKNQTNYLTKKEIIQLFGEHFDNVISCERDYIKHHPRGYYLYQMSRIFTFIPLMFSVFRTKAILVEQPKKFNLSE